MDSKKISLEKNDDNNEVLLDNKLTSEDIKIDELEIKETAKEAINETREELTEELENEETILQEEIVTSNRIKNYIEKPLTRKEKKEKKDRDLDYEKKYDKKQFHVKEKKSFKFKIMLGLIITLFIILLFRYGLKIDMTVLFKTLEIPSVIASVVLIIISIYLIFSETSRGYKEPDPVTDFFIISKGKISGLTRKNHENKINSRFLMITFLKLYQKDLIAIINGRIIYGTINSKLSLDEKVILDFLFTNEIETIDDFLDILKTENPVQHLGILGKIDNFYEAYKNSVIDMAIEKDYINQSIGKAKFVLRSGGIVFFFIVLALLAKGQGELSTLLLYSAQGGLLLVIANFIYARSKSAHLRIAEIKRQKRTLQSPKEDIYVALIYNYIFGKEEKALKKIQKFQKDGTISSKEYEKFSETYNSLNYILDFMKDDK